MLHERLTRTGCNIFVLVLLLTASRAIAEENSNNSKTAVEVSASLRADDSVGSRLVYRIKEEILKSASYRLTTHGRRMRINITTLPIDSESKDDAACYALVVNLVLPNSDGAVASKMLNSNDELVIYVKSLVGIVGTNRVQPVAEAIVATLGT